MIFFNLKCQDGCVSREIYVKGKVYVMDVYTNIPEDIKISKYRLDRDVKT